MTTEVMEQPKPVTRRRTRQSPVPVRPAEFIAFCPHCKAFATVWLAGDALVNTRKFTQRGNLVYHDCGALEACRLLPRFLKGGQTEPAGVAAARHA